jgi:hypothetical protein
VYRKQHAQRKAVLLCGMSTATMEEWFNMFNANMKKENRSAIFFLDNASFHQKVTLSNVKIALFPANATSVLQPMDLCVR